MSKIIIYNATVLTLDEEDSFFYPGTVEIAGDRIAKVYNGSPSAELEDDPSITFIDGTDKLIMPGLVDLHFHTSVAKVKARNCSILSKHELTRDTIRDSAMSCRSKSIWMRSGTRASEP